MHVPLAKTVLVITFLVGLLPVVGNLISNTIIVILSLSVSLPVAIASLIFLVVIHKFEYFLNAHMIGTQVLGVVAGDARHGSGFRHPRSHRGTDLLRLS